MSTLESPCDSAAPQVTASCSPLKMFTAVKSSTRPQGSDSDCPPLNDGLDSPPNAVAENAVREGHAENHHKDDLSPHVIEHERTKGDLSEQQLKALPAIRITNFPLFVSQNESGRFFRSITPLLPTGVQLAYEIVPDEEVRRLRGECVAEIDQRSSEGRAGEGSEICPPQVSDGMKHVEDFLQWGTKEKEIGDDIGNEDEEKKPKTSKGVNDHDHRRQLAFNDRLDCWTSPEGVVKRRIVYLFPRNNECTDLLMALSGLKALRLSSVRRSNDTPHCQYDIDGETFTIRLPHELEASRITWFDVPHYVKKPIASQLNTRHKGTGGQGYKKTDHPSRGYNNYFSGNNTGNRHQKNYFNHTNTHLINNAAPSSFIGMMPNFMGVGAVPAGMLGQLQGMMGNQHGGVSPPLCPTATVSPASTNLTPNMSVISNLMTNRNFRITSSGNDGNNLDMRNKNCHPNHSIAPMNMNTMMGGGAYKSTNQANLIMHQMMQHQMNNFNGNGNNFGNPMRGVQNTATSSYQNVGNNNNTQQILLQLMQQQQQSQRAQNQQQVMLPANMPQNTPSGQNQLPQCVQLPPGTVLIPIQNVPAGAIPIDVSW